jgi:large subunit ribosomal protein L1
MLQKLLQRLKQIDFKVDKTGIVHAGIGKVSFAEQIDNAHEIIQTLIKLKPTAAGCISKVSTLQAL